MSFGGTKFGLDAQNLVFSNMIDAYGGTYPLVTNLPYSSVEKQIFPRFSTGVVFSMLGNNSSNKLNRTIIGYSFQTLNENFQYSTSLTKKQKEILEEFNENNRYHSCENGVFEIPWKTISSN